jgi:hypothetical protein
MSLLQRSTPVVFASPSAKASYERRRNYLVLLSVTPALVNCVLSLWFRAPREDARVWFEGLTAASFLPSFWWGLANRLLVSALPEFELKLFSIVVGVALLVFVGRWCFDRVADPLASVLASSLTILWLRTASPVGMVSALVVTYVGLEALRAPKYSKMRIAFWAALILLFFRPEPPLYTDVWWQAPYLVVMWSSQALALGFLVVGLLVGLGRREFFFAGVVAGLTTVTLVFPSARACLVPALAITACFLFHAVRPSTRFVVLSAGLAMASLVALGAYQGVVFPLLPREAVRFLHAAGVSGTLHCDPAWRAFVLRDLDSQVTWVPPERAAQISLSSSFSPAESDPHWVVAFENNVARVQVRRPGTNLDLTERYYDEQNLEFSIEKGFVLGEIEEQQPEWVAGHVDRLPKNRFLSERKFASWRLLQDSDYYESRGLVGLAMKHVYEALQTDSGDERLAIRLGELMVRSGEWELARRWLATLESQGIGPRALVAIRVPLYEHDRVR